MADKLDVNAFVVGFSLCFSLHSTQASVSSVCVVKFNSFLLLKMFCTEYKLGYFVTPFSIVLVMLMVCAVKFELIEWLYFI